MVRLTLKTGNEAELVFGRLERRVALDQRQTDNAGFRDGRLTPAPECSVGSRIESGLRAGRRRQTASFDQGIRHRRQIEKPVFPEFFFQNRQVAFDHVRVVRIERLVWKQAQRLDETPAVPDRKFFAAIKRRWWHNPRRIDERQARLERCALRPPAFDRELLGPAGCHPRRELLRR